MRLLVRRAKYESPPTGGGRMPDFYEYRIVYCEDHVTLPAAEKVVAVLA